MEPQEIDMSLAAKSEKVVAVQSNASEAVPTKTPALLQLHWTMGFDLAGKDDLFLSGTRDIPLRPSRADLIRDGRTGVRRLPVDRCRRSRNQDSRCAIRPTAALPPIRRPRMNDHSRSMRRRPFKRGCSIRRAMARQHPGKRINTCLPVRVFATAFTKATGLGCRTSAN